MFVNFKIGNTIYKVVVVNPFDLPEDMHFDSSWRSIQRDQGKSGWSNVKTSFLLPYKRPFLNMT